MNQQLFRRRDVFPASRPRWASTPTRLSRAGPSGPCKAEVLEVPSVDVDPEQLDSWHDFAGLPWHHVQVWTVLMIFHHVGRHQFHNNRTPCKLKASAAVQRPAWVDAQESLSQRVGAKQALQILSFKAMTIRARYEAA